MLRAPEPPLSGSKRAARGGSSSAPRDPDAAAGTSGGGGGDGAMARPFARYLLRIQYDGGTFHGFQRQANARTVQGCVEEAMAKFTGVEGGVHAITGSSRTDAGVHALDATAHVDIVRTTNACRKRLKKNANANANANGGAAKDDGDAGDAPPPPPHSARTVMKAVNHYLRKTAPMASIASCARVCPETFHARYCATARTYRYLIYLGRDEPSVFDRGKAWHVYDGRNASGAGVNTHEPSGGCALGGLDVDAMNAAARRFVGEHDFSAFRANGCQASSPIRRLHVLRVDRAMPWPSFPSIASQDSMVMHSFDVAKPMEEDDLSEVLVPEAETEGKKEKTPPPPRKPPSGRVTSGHIVITARAPSFLYHQVRLMVGTLRAVGAGELSPDDVTDLLEGTTDASRAPPMAPAHGLYLERVHYDGRRRWRSRRAGQGAEGDVVPGGEEGEEEEDEWLDEEGSER
jgi:tRNA pseudouridine38-40 synthase